MTTSLLTLEIPLVTQRAVFFYSTEIMEMFSTLIVFGDRLKMSNIGIRYEYDIPALNSGDKMNV